MPNIRNTISSRVRSILPGKNKIVVKAVKKSKTTASGWEEEWVEDWDPERNLPPNRIKKIAEEVESDFRPANAKKISPRDKWLTPLLDWTAVFQAFDPDQERTEAAIRGEALINQEESRKGIRYAIQLILVPLLTGFIISHVFADPILNYTLENSPEAFAMTDHQKVEGAQAMHVEEVRQRMQIAIGRIKPKTEEQMFMHLREFAMEVQDEERHHNESALITAVSDSVTAVVLIAGVSQKTRGRVALTGTIYRAFNGLSDIAKAVLIILVADTLLGYHSEEGWTALIEVVLGRYGIEPEEGPVVIFVGVVPVVIDVFFKFWIFSGLNKISPSAVVTIKQLDRH